MTKDLVHYYAGWPGKCLCGAQGKAVSSNRNDQVTCEQCLTMLNPALPSSKTESNRDKVLRGEVVKVTDDRLREMQEQARRMMGVGDTEYHWHWSAVINELIARRADETSPKHQGWCASINPDPCNCGVAAKGASEWCPHYDLPIVNQPGCPDCAYEKTTGQWDPRAVAVKQDPHCATCKCFSEEPSPVIADPTRWPMPPPPKTWMPAWLREFHCQCETSGDAAGKCVACQAADLIEKSPSNGNGI